MSSTSTSTWSPRFEPTDLTPPWIEVEHPLESLRGLAEEIRAWR
ncbi:hypothetical protein [Nonomuraea basaltis]|nr:hypothetical protein [Nonomuraea basaltis]